MIMSAHLSKARRNSLKRSATNFSAFQSGVVVFLGEPGGTRTHDHFAGTAVVIFQPAEEGGAGGLAMLKDGLMERFAIEEVYGMHNFPGLPIGKFSIRSGPIMASTDNLTVDIEGVGGHAA